MIIRVQEFLNVNNYITINTDGYIIGKNSIDKSDCRGFYFEKESLQIIVFCFQKQIIIMVNNNIYNVNDDKISVKYEKEEGNHRIVNIYKDLKLVENIYYLNEFDPISTLSYSEEDSDVDFGLWLSNLINSEERRGIFCDAWESNS